MLEKIFLTNWRNWQNLSLNFKDKNILSGLNGVGKTNTIEAIFYCANGSSWKNIKDDNLIKWEEPYFEIKLLFDDKDEIIYFFGYQNDRRIKSIKINGVNRARSKINEKLKVILFSPEQIEQLSTGSGRRQYLNQLISQKDNHYRYNLRQYSKVITAKNKILERIREGFSDKSELLFWNQRLVEYASLIIKSRREWMLFVNSQLVDKYHHISGRKEKINLEYRPRTAIEKLEEKIDENTNKEIQAGISLYGPHRDDWMVVLNGSDIISSASRGEWRSILASLKIVEANFISGEIKPIILLDDIFSELDKKRRMNFLSQLTDYQLIISSAETLEKSLLQENWNIIELDEKN